MKIPRLVTMLLAGMLLACSMSFVHASDASQAQLAPVDTSLTTAASSNAEDSTGYSNDGASAGLPLAFYDRVNRLACTVHYVELRFNSAQDMEDSMYDIAGWITAIINSHEYTGCYHPGFEVFFTAFVGGDTVQIFGQDMSVPLELAEASSSSAEASSSGAASSTSSTASSVSSAAPSASSAAPSDEPVKDKHELRRKDLAVLYPRNGTHAGPSVLPDSDDGQPQPSLISAAPRHPSSIVVTSVFVDSNAPSTKTVSLMPTADVVPTANNLPPMATIDVNHSLENRALNFPSSPDYNESDHLSVLCTHCSLNGKVSITQGGWRSPSSDGHFTPSLGWFNITFTDFTDALELRLQGQDSGRLKFPMYPGNDDEQPLHIAGISVPGLGKAGILLRPYVVVDWNFTSPTTINYCAGKLWQDAPTYLHVDFANLTNASPTTQFAYRPLLTDPHTTPFHGRSMDVLHAFGSLIIRLEMQLLIVFEESPNTNDTSIAAAGHSGVPHAAATINVDWPSVDAQFVPRPVAEFETMCYNWSNGTRAAYALWKDDHRVAANFSADHPTVVFLRSRKASTAVAYFGNLFPWVTGAEQKALLKEGWEERHHEDWEFACYVWLEQEQRFEEAGGVMERIKEGLEREDAAVGKAAAAANTNDPELSDGTEGVKEGGAAAREVLSTFVVGLVLAVAALVCF